MDFDVHVPDRPVVLTLTFKRAEEANNLLRELKTWTPTGGWTSLAEDLFQALECAAREQSIMVED